MKTIQVWTWFCIHALDSAISAGNKENYAQFEQAIEQCEHRGEFGEGIEAERTLQSALRVYRIHQIVRNASGKLLLLTSVGALFWTIFYPNFQKFSCRKDQYEARGKLKALFVMQKEHYLKTLEVKTCKMCRKSALSDKIRRNLTKNVTRRIKWLYFQE
ncbi:MAG: hypothetical protein GY822_30440 [Deltaproteobacteria bacterium]|nr:hypothetical protein [Deltaproteobacteria bacterium]